MRKCPYCQICCFLARPSKYKFYAFSYICVGYLIACVSSYTLRVTPYKRIILSSTAPPVGIPSMLSDRFYDGYPVLYNTQESTLCRLLGLVDWPTAASRRTERGRRTREQGERWNERANHAVGVFDDLPPFAISISRPDIDRAPLDTASPSDAGRRHCCDAIELSHPLRGAAVGNGSSRSSSVQQQQPYLRSTKQ